MEFLTIFLRNRKSYRKLGQLVFTFCGYAPVVKLYNLFGYRKSKTGAAAVRTSCGIQPEKLLEYTL